MRDDEAWRGGPSRMGCGKEAVKEGGNHGPMASGSLWLVPFSSPPLALAVCVHVCAW